MTLLHAYSQTVADGTATSVVRPSDWNSGHNQFVTLSGNTAGQSTISGTNIVYQGGNNVTLSAITAAGAATIVVSGGNTTQFAGTGTTFAGTNIAATLSQNSNGIALSLNNVDAHIQGWALTGANTAGTTATTVTTTAPIYFSGGNGITLSGNSNTIIISGANGGGGGGTLSYLNVGAAGQIFANQLNDATLYLQYFEAPNVSFCRVDNPLSVSLRATTSFTLFGASTTTSSGANTWAMTRTYGLYSRGTGTNSTRIELMPGSTTVSMGYAEGYTYAISNSTSGNTLAVVNTGTHRATNGFSIFGPVSVGTNGGVTYTTLGFEATTSKATGGSGTNTTVISISVGNVSTSLFTGMRDLAFGMATSLAQNNYWMGMLQKSGSTSAGQSDFGIVASMSLMVNTSAPVAFQNVMATTANSTSGYLPFHGQYSTTSAALPSVVGSNQYIPSGNSQFNIPYLLANQVV